MAGESVLSIHVSGPWNPMPVAAACDQLPVRPYAGRSAAAGRWSFT
jgi:hypothetical protein